MAENNPDNKSGSGRIVMIVIFLLVGYVAYSMTAQTPSDAPGPTVPSLAPEAKKLLDAKANPYVGQLLAPSISESDRFNSILKSKLATTPGASSPYTSVNPLTAATISLADSKDKEAMAATIADAEKSYSNGDTSGGIGAVNIGLIYHSGHKLLPVSDRITLLITGAKLCHKAKDFDKAREYINEAQQLSLANGGYQMGTIEGLRLVLNGHEAEATNYNLKLSQFNAALNNDSLKSQLPALGDAVMDAASKLPEDSPFRRQAEVCKASGFKFAGNSDPSVKTLIADAAERAKKANDSLIEQQCQSLLSAYKNQ